MRLLIAIGIIVGLVFYAKHALSSKEGMLGAVVKERLQEPIHLTDRTAAMAATAKEKAASEGPEESGLSLFPTPSLPAQSQPVPLPPPVASVYRFQHREPPAPEQLAGLQSIGLTVVVDRQSRFVIVRGPSDAVDAAMPYLQAIDVVGGSCAVQTWAVYVDRSVQKGFDLTAAVRSVTGLESTADLGTGSFTLNLSAGDVSAALNAIADGSSVEVVQRPHVRLAHATTSRIESTQEYPIPMATLSNGVSQQSIQYRKVGLQLEVTPYFVDRDSVRLDVKQTNGLIGNSVKIEGNDIPVIQSQSVETVAEITVGQTIILGGVSTQRLRVNRGLLRNTREIAEGALYIVLSTYEDVPKALPVGTPPIDAPASNRVPFAAPLEDPRDWIDGQLLPPPDWKTEERRFLRARAAK